MPIGCGFKHRSYPTFSARAYFALASFDCNPASNRAEDLRTMGDVAQFEYLCLAHFVERFGRLPEFNDKNAPKFRKYRLTRGPPRDQEGEHARGRG